MNAKTLSAPSAPPGFKPHYPAQVEQNLVVCGGIGQDSTGMLVGLAERGIKPKLVIVAGVGSERPETYAFRAIMDRWMQAVWAITGVTVRHEPKDYKHWPEYHTLLENCLTNVTLPSLAYGFHTCSAKWKITPINKYVAVQPWAQAIRPHGGKIKSNGRHQAACSVGPPRVPNRKPSARWSVTIERKNDESTAKAFGSPTARERHREPANRGCGGGRVYAHRSQNP